MLLHTLAQSSSPRLVFYDGDAVVGLGPDEKRGRWT